MIVLNAAVPSMSIESPPEIATSTELAVSARLIETVPNELSTWTPTSAPLVESLVIVKVSLELVSEISICVVAPMPSPVRETLPNASISSTSLPFASPLMLAPSIVTLSAMIESFARLTAPPAVIVTSSPVPCGVEMGRVAVSPPTVVI